MKNILPGMVAMPVCRMSPMFSEENDTEKRLLKNDFTTEALNME